MRIKKRKIRIAILISNGYYYAIGIMNFLKSAIVPEPSAIDVYDSPQELCRTDLKGYDLLILDMKIYKHIEECPSLYNCLPKDGRLMVLLACLKPCIFNAEEYRYKGIKGVLPLGLDIYTFSKFMSLILNNKSQEEIDFLLSDARRQYDQITRKVDNKSQWVEGRIHLLETKNKVIIEALRRVSE